MKIYGTAKGGALSKKDFGVAFGGSSAVSCDFTDDFTGYADQAAADAVYPYEVGGTIVCKVIVASDLIQCAYPVTTATNNFLGTCTRQTDCNTDDTAWVLRFTNTISAGPTQTGGVSTRNFIGMTDKNYESSTNVAQSGIGMFSQVQATINAFKTRGVNDGELTGGADSTFSTYVPANGETDYIEIIRTSGTTYTVEAFSNSGYSTSIEKESDNCSSSIDGLDYLSFKGSESRTGSALTTEIPDVAFANAVTEYPT